MCLKEKKNLPVYHNIGFLDYQYRYWYRSLKPYIAQALII